MSLYPKLLGGLSIISIIVLVSCQDKEFHSQRNLDFNLDWKFVEDSVIGAETIDFNDADWINVDLPHDWSVTDYPMQDSVHIGPFYKNTPLGHDVGYLRGGTGWYRKGFTVEPENAGKEVILQFDGIMGESVLWVNGQKVGEHVYGYTPFNINITEFLNASGEKNVLAIQVFIPTESSRWFTGAGLYRSVEISYLDRVHIDVWGVVVQPDLIEESTANLKVGLDIVNSNSKNQEIEVHTEVINPEGAVVSTQVEKLSVSSADKNNTSISTQIQDPVLWGISNPQLYTLKVSLFENGKQIDEYAQKFGIRTIDYSVERGFLLNGKNILLKGACMHHDNGLLGAAALQKAEERRVQIMKENGYNAIRTSHNPPSKYFLEACDKIGMLVIDEAFDMWVKPKRPNDYHQFFEEWWKKDLESMILRDRNHPSVIMWSFGNEVPERADSMGIAIGKNCISTISSIDDTRPITQAICGFWDNPGKVWDDSAPAFKILDIGGYNYQWANYESDHVKHPNRIMFGSESVPSEAFDNWQLVEKLPYVIGDFVWTGMDYIGESGIGHSTYPKPNEKQRGLMPWPTYISWCGDIDIIGNKKPQSFYRDVIWGESSLEIMVHEPNPTGNEEVTSFWGWPNEVPSWNWKGHEGEVLEVNVYSSYSTIRLELNGKIMQEKSISIGSRFTTTFKVPYTPGTLKAVGIGNVEEKEVKIIRTTGSMSIIKLIPEQKEIEADRGSIAFIQVEAVDENGYCVNTSSEEIHVAVQGEGKLLAAGNANPKLEGSFQDNAFRLFRGKGLIIVRSTGQEGQVKITVKAAGKIVGSTTLTAKN